MDWIFRWETEEKNKTIVSAGLRLVKPAVTCGRRPMGCRLRLRGGGALAAGVAVIGQDGAPAPGPWHTGWPRGLQTPCLPASPPSPEKTGGWEKKMAKDNTYRFLLPPDICCIEMYSLHLFECQLRESDVRVHVTLTKEEMGKVAKSETFAPPGCWETTCSATSPWERDLMLWPFPWKTEISGQNLRWR
jgi:hypothetical protein